MAQRAYIVTLGFLLLAGLTACKEGERRFGLPDGQCLRTLADGRVEVYDCDDGSMNQPDATPDATNVPDATPDAMADGGIEEGGMDAGFMLPTNACLPDLQKSRPIPDAGVDGGSVSVLTLAEAAAGNFDSVVTCAAGGFGPSFIMCVANTVAAAVPELSEDCPTCFAALTECAVGSCASGDNDACLFANQANPTAEELAECNKCRCDNACLADFDVCTGFGTVPSASANQACVPTDGCLGDVANIEAAQNQLLSAALTCLGTLNNDVSWRFVVCVREAVVAAVDGFSEECGTCLAIQTQCGVVNGCTTPCQDLESPACAACLCEAGCPQAFDSCAGLDTTSTTCPAPDAGAGDAGAGDAGVDSGT